jgi:tetratricopeptide (TPR) repeat protein
LKGNYDIGVKKMNQKKYGLAVLYFNEAIAYNPKDVDAYYNMGVAFIKMKNNVKACESWNKGKELGDSGVLSLINKYCNQ